MKFYFFILASFLFPLYLSGQNVGAGLSLGTNFCQVDGDFFKGYNKIGINAGGYAWYDFDERISLQAEILYSVKGARANTGGLGVYHLRLNYVDFPIIGNYRIIGDYDLGFSIQAGLVPGYLLFAKLGPSGLITTVTQNYRKLSTEVSAGISADLAPKISAFARWHYSIRDISAFADPTTSFKQTNHYVTFGLRIGTK